MLLPAMKGNANFGKMLVCSIYFENIKNQDHKTTIPLFYSLTLSYTMQKQKQTKEIINISVLETHFQIYIHQNESLLLCYHNVNII